LSSSSLSWPDRRRSHIIDWLVKDGERVEQGQSVLEVETDKAVFPVEANASG